MNVIQAAEFNVVDSVTTDGVNKLPIALPHTEVLHVHSVEPLTPLATSKLSGLPNSNFRIE